MRKAADILLGLSKPQSDQQKPVKMAHLARRHFYLLEVDPIAVGLLPAGCLAKRGFRASL